jgi:hypothetical protein
MKKVNESERCTETFELEEEGRVVRCSKKQGHFGKHISSDDCWQGWTDQGKQRVLRERAERQQTKA